MLPFFDYDNEQSMKNNHSHSRGGVMNLVCEEEGHRRTQNFTMEGFTWWGAGPESLRDKSPSGVQGRSPELMGGVPRN